jgi:phospholipase/carboxylesterase
VIAPRQRQAGGPRTARLAGWILVTVGVTALAGCRPGPAAVAHPGSALRTIEVGTGPLPFVLLHGYGSSADEWLPFTYTIELPADRRFVLPDAPETTTPPDGPSNGRAWWRLDLGAYRRPGDQLPDLSRQNPPALAASTRRIRRLLDELATTGGYGRERQILAGYSQGGMIAADIAFTTDEPLEALVLLSPTFVNERVWRDGMPRRRGLRVFISHGRQDGILPFDVAARLQQAMRDAGLRVTWVPFDGGHEMPMTVVDALNAFLAGRDGPDPPSRAR